MAIQERAGELDRSQRGRQNSAAHADMDLLFAAVRALHELASDPEQSGDAGSIYDFSIRWGVLLAGRLHRLEHYAGLGELDADEKQRFDELIEQLREAAPITENLGLARPSLAE